MGHLGAQARLLLPRQSRTRAGLRELQPGERAMPLLLPSHQLGFHSQVCLYPLRPLFSEGLLILVSNQLAIHHRSPELKSLPLVH